MTFKAIHMLIAEVEQSSNGPPEYNRRRHDFKVAGRSRASASRRRVNAVIIEHKEQKFINNHLSVVRRSF